MASEAKYGIFFIAKDLRLVVLPPRVILPAEVYIIKSSL